jgi:chemotaxis signal transduction protein
LTVVADATRDPLRRLERLEQDLVRLRAELFPVTAGDALPGSVDVLIARVSETLVAVPVADVLEVIPRVPTVPLPAAPPHLVGHMRWRGSHVAVIDPTFLWTGHGLTPHRLEDRIVVVQSDGVRRGLLVPEILGVDRLLESDWNPVESAVGGAEYARALAHRPAGSVLLISLPNLFAAAPLPATMSLDPTPTEKGEETP